MTRQKTSFYIFLPSSKLTISIISIYKHYKYFKVDRKENFKFDPRVKGLSSFCQKINDDIGRLNDFYSTWEPRQPRKIEHGMFTTFIIITHLGCVPLGESGSGFLICGVPFEQIHFQISDLSNPLWTRIHRITDVRDLKTDNWITDLRDLKTDHWITDPTRSFGRRIRN